MAGERSCWLNVATFPVRRRLSSYEDGESVYHVSTRTSLSAAVDALIASNLAWSFEVSSVALRIRSAVDGSDRLSLFRRFAAMKSFTASTPAWRLTPSTAEIVVPSRSAVFSACDSIPCRLFSDVSDPRSVSSLLTKPRSSAIVACWSAGELKRVDSGETRRGASSSGILAMPSSSRAREVVRSYTGGSPVAASRHSSPWESRGTRTYPPLVAHCGIFSNLNAPDSSVTVVSVDPAASRMTVHDINGPMTDATALCTTDCSFGGCDPWTTASSVTVTVGGGAMGSSSTVAAGNRTLSMTCTVVLHTVIVFVIVATSPRTLVSVGGAPIAAPDWTAMAKASTSFSRTPRSVVNDWR
mmetsp:Transcript_3816/g.10908  ORF Transcript_3816/g.10908 Transcript_3816/m.10908 type:complete len:355 (-) Transcript_3816:2716-3780(-)